jgi:arylsulfatase A-like enzyme
MKKHAILFGILSVAILSGVAADKPVPQRPNILIIFTDDQGYADLGCYGNKKNKTPRMDRLAGEGTRFTSFYAQFVCGPSRSALLTGRYPNLSKGWSMPATEITFAQQMREVGYQTACVGKWDVSNRKPIIDRMPNAKGFEYYFGPLGANDAGIVTFHENNQAAGSTKDMASLSRLYTDKAIDWLKNKRSPDKPFVLYLAHTMMHVIIDASPQFKGKSGGGLYGDVVEEFDFETGRLLDQLEALGLKDNTLVIYTTDNGPWNQKKFTEKKKGHPAGSIFWGDAGPLRNGKGSCYEGGYRAPCIVRWPGKVPAGKVSDAMWATVDFLPTFASLTGFQVPKDRTIDGIDQTDLLLGKTDKGRESFYYDRAGIRMGKWKYLTANAFSHDFAMDPNRKQEEELYDLDKDIGETTNVAKQHPEIVATMKQAFLKIDSRATGQGSEDPDTNMGKESPKKRKPVR